MPVKHNFTKHKFDIPIFSGMIKRAIRWDNGRVKRARDGSAAEETVK